MGDPLYAQGIDLAVLLITLLKVVLTFVFPRGRVLTVPLVFVLIIVALFWSARRSAERENT